MEHGELSELGYMSDKSESWSWDQNKAFETALATYLDDEGGDRWERIAAAVEGKVVEDVLLHYQVLEEDVDAIEGDRVPLPTYSEDEVGDGDACGKKGGDGKASRAEQGRRKGIAWSEEEHRLFLQGLEKYGKGDWRSISRNYVITRTPTQVASHAQKYFIRLQSGTKDKRRSSIHDITSVHEGDSQGPITGQNSAPSSAGSPRVSSAPAIGHPVPGVHALGTPVLPPNPVPPHIAYRMPVPAPNIMVPAPGGAIENQTEKPYPEHQMEDAHLDIQTEKPGAENKKQNTKSTHPKPNKRR